MLVDGQKVKISIRQYEQAQLGMVCLLMYHRLHVNIDRCYLVQASKFNWANPTS